MQAFDDFWTHDDVGGFSQTTSANWQKLGLVAINAQINFSPRSAQNAVMQSIADDVGQNTKSNLFFSLAFLYETPGPLLDSIKQLQQDDQKFSYGISDRPVGGLDVAKPDGKVVVVSPAELSKNLPQPFKAEPVGGGGTMHRMGCGTVTVKLVTTAFCAGLIVRVSVRVTRPPAVKVTRT
jgi:hypothetical protein